MKLKNKKCRSVYRVRWSEKDQAYIGTNTGYPGLSWLDRSSTNAFKGIIKLVKTAEKNKESWVPWVARDNF